MSTRLDMLAGLALAGLSANPRHGTDDDAEKLAGVALARAKALDALLGSENSPSASTPPVSPSLAPEDVRGIVREMLEEVATAPAPAKGKR